MLDLGRRCLAAGLLLGGLAGASVARPAPAQESGMGRSLGGYGAATITSYYTSVSGPLIPYAGGAGGFVPIQALEPSAPTLPLVPRMIRTTPIGGRSGMATPIGGASRMGTRARFGTPSLPGAGMGVSGGAPGRVGRMQAPGLAYPFRQPPRLGGGGGAAMGSM